MVEGASGRGGSAPVPPHPGPGLAGLECHLCVRLSAP